MTPPTGERKVPRIRTAAVAKHRQKGLGPKGIEPP
jgi:hypothetical protein